MKDHIILTNAMIRQGQSRRGGWNKEQFKCLGITWPPKKGWRRPLHGSKIERKSFERFLELKNSHIKN